MSTLEMIWDYINRFASVLTIFTVAFSGFAAWKLAQQSRRVRELARKTPPIKNFQELVNYHRGVQTSHPVALAISLIPQSVSIKGDVQRFLNTSGLKMNIEELSLDGINDPNDLEIFVNQLRTKRRELEAMQATEIHAFLAGPVVAGVILGAMFDNWIPVKLYHKPTPPPPSVYEYWMPLIKN